LHIAKHQGNYRATLDRTVVMPLERVSTNCAVLLLSRAGGI